MACHVKIVYTLFEFRVDDPDKFTIEFVHNGFFCGLKDNLCYESGSVDFFDNCSTDTFSLLWVEDLLRQDDIQNIYIYWCLEAGK
jgi:hypothetical protein